MRATHWSVIVITAALGLGCGSALTDPVPTDAQLVGGWRLRTVQRQPLPYAVPPVPYQDPGDRTQLYDGTLSFSAGVAEFSYADYFEYKSAGGFVSKYHLGGGPYGSYVGSYVARVGSTLELRAQGLPTLVARLDGDSLRVHRDTLETVYTRWTVNDQAPAP